MLKRVCNYKTPTCFDLFSWPSSGGPSLCFVPLLFLPVICVRWVCIITQYVAAGARARVCVRVHVRVCACVHVCIHTHTYVTHCIYKTRSIMLKTPNVVLKNIYIYMTSGVLSIMKPPFKLQSSADHNGHLIPVPKWYHLFQEKAMNWIKLAFDV